MSYIGNTPEIYQYDSATEKFSGNASKTVFPLTRRVLDVDDVIAIVENVIQEPTAAYTLSANATSGLADITFTSAPPSGANNIQVRYSSQTFNTYNLVTAEQLQANSVTMTKISATGTANANTYLRGDGTWGYIGLNNVTGDFVITGNATVSGSFLAIPRGNTAQRTSTPTYGSLYYNTEVGQLQGYATTGMWSKIANLLTTYTGSGSDGALSTVGNVTHTVQNKVGSYDGDMVVKNYTTLTINAGHTMTVDQPCRGMMIFVQGDCTIAGTLSMKGKGAAADPTVSGGSDSNAVSASGLRIPFVTNTGTDTLVAANTLFNGCGTAARSAIANFSSISGSGTTVTIGRVGGAGGSGAGTNAVAGSPGAPVTSSGGGGSGVNDGTSFRSPSTAGNGGYGSCFGGGSGGGGTTNGGSYSGPTADAANYGFAGGAGLGNAGAQAGVGNPPGTSTPGNSQTGSGTGGLIILIVGGSLTISGTITAAGVDGAGTTTYGAGGASGGGVIVVAYKGTLTNSGTVTVAGGTGDVTDTGARVGAYGGSGGAGYSTIFQIV